MSLVRALAIVAIAMTLSACDTLFPEDGVPVETIVFDRAYLATTCLAGETTPAATRTALPCVVSTTATTQRQVDSARIYFNPSHIATLKIGVTTRPLGCATCAATPEVTTYTGQYDTIADSVMVTLPAPGLDGALKLPFFSDIPDRVQPYFVGPDSVMFKAAPGRFLLFRPGA